jgi:hypothetical protein
MVPTEKADLDKSRITNESRLFAEELFERFPEFRRYATMERQSGDESWNLVVVVPAPSGDPKTDMTVWVQKGDPPEPSVEFGMWHTHESVWAEIVWYRGIKWGESIYSESDRSKLLNLIAGILAERFILCEDIGGVGDGSVGILDLSREDAILEELTSKYSPGRVRLRSWTGRLDREMSLDDLDLSST